LKRFIVLCGFAMIQGCADDSNDENVESAEQRTERKCREFLEALCGQYVRCRVVEPSSGVAFTGAACGDALADAIAECVAKSSDGIAETSDRDLDACARAIRDQGCELVCNRMPESPAECLELDSYEPPTSETVCETRQAPTRRPRGRSSSVGR
jgi:hypothetical protein